MTETSDDNLSLPYAAPGDRGGAPEPGDSSAASAYRAGLHRIALATAIATFPLIFMGGLVTSHGAGMSVPDWPNSYGYNMFLFPVSQWRGGILYEHTHRLMGTVVGLASILLALRAWGTGREPKRRKQLWIGAGIAVAIALLSAVTLPLVPTGERAERIRAGLGQSVIVWSGMAVVLVCATFMRERESRRWARWLATAVLGAVIFQGVLGGLRVVLVKLDLAIVHACVAQAFFCLATLTAIVTSRWWFEAPDLSRSADSAAGRRLIVACGIATAAIFAQLIVGATMRHYQAGLAVPDLPLAYGQVIPATDGVSLQKINALRAWKLRLPPVTAAQIWLHMAHRFGAVIVTAALCWLIAATLRQDRGPLVRTAVALGSTVLSIALLGLAHAVGSTRGVLPGFCFFAPAVLLGAASMRLLRALRTPLRLRGPAVVVAALLLIQLALGVLTVLYRKPADVASAHVAVGALTLVTTFLLTVRSVRLYRWRADANPATIRRDFETRSPARAGDLAAA